MKLEVDEVARRGRRQVNKFGVGRMRFSAQAEITWQITPEATRTKDELMKRDTSKRYHCIPDVLV